MLEERIDRADVAASVPSPRHDERRPWPGWVVAMLIVVLAVGAVGFDQWAAHFVNEKPGDRSAEVGFARDMATHHGQAVAMATLLRDRTDDPELRQLALDIMLTQQAQIGQMQGWLAIWGQPVASTEPAMAWMGLPTMGLMPGMASQADVNHLRDLEGREAEVLFLNLMIPHHRAGVMMAEAVLERSRRPEVRALARAIVDGQASEIARMQELLVRRGAPPVREDALDHRGGTGHEPGTGTAVPGR